MAILLSVDPGFAGGTKMEYDISPTERVQVLVPTASAHLVLGIIPDDLIGQSLTDVRPPASRRSNRR